MNKSMLLLLPLFLGIVSCNQNNKIEESAKNLADELPENKQPEKVLRHVVLFKFKNSATEADIKQIVEAFEELPQKIDGILDFEWGTDISPEGLSDGYTHVFLVSFKNEKSRDEYLPHPAHKAFGGIVGPHLDKVLVVDYWPKD